MPRVEDPRRSLPRKDVGGNTMRPLPWPQQESQFRYRSHIAHKCFLGIFEDGELVGCGGVNKDPYVIQHVGRLRHVYVLSSARRKGLATELVRELLRRCGHSFSVFRLRTSDKNADAFYETFGFERSNDEDASHFLATR